MVPGRGGNVKGSLSDVNLQQTAKDFFTQIIRQEGVTSPKVINIRSYAVIDFLCLPNKETVKLIKIMQEVNSLEA